ncbi:FAD-dependent oxidoreductase [Myxococcota bacterium]|nr:FAD-dependent oxidoreductase [Myxococcota bacterium]
MASIRIPAETLRVQEELDLLVIGGGSAGVTAAVTGARLGLRTGLVEEMPGLGGMSTGGAVGTYCGFYKKGPGATLVPTVGGLPLEIADSLLARGHAIGPIPLHDTAVLPYVPMGVQHLLEELVRREPRLRVRLHSRLTHVLVDEGLVRGVAVDTRGERIGLRARVYVDASGDAVLSRLAGVETLREGTLQYPSMMFTMQNVDVARAIGAIRSLPGLLESHFVSDQLPRRSGNLIPTGRPGEVLVALSRVEFEGRPVDAAVEQELSFAELEGRAQAVRLAEFVRREIPGFADAFLSHTASRLGVRETRKIAGEYVLREDDVLGARDFADGIGRCAWPIERHVAGGHTSWSFLEPGASYAIPFRCLVPRGVDNLLVAGRCLSADSAAFASARVIGPCMLAGQAVAVAAQQICTDDVATSRVDVERLRATLSGWGVPL